MENSKVIIDSLIRALKILYLKCPIFTENFYIFKKFNKNPVIFPFQKIKYYLTTLQHSS